MSTENTTQNEGENTTDNVKDEVAEVIGGESVTGEAVNAGVGGEVERLRADAERFRDMALRGQADFDNYRKRAARGEGRGGEVCKLGVG